MEDEYNSPIDSAISNVLSSKRLLLVHPSANKFNQMYASPSESTSNLAEVVNSRGRLRFSGNSKSLPGRTDYYISSSSLVSDFILNVVVRTTAAHQLNRGWLFQMIERIEITYANSLIQNLVVSGDIVREYLLLSCCNQVAREAMLLNAGDSVFGEAGDQSASIPIHLLNQNGNGVCSAHPLDFSTMNGPLTISVVWNSSAAWAFTSNDVAFVPITDLISSQVTAQTSDLQDGAFSVKRAMTLNPGLVYSVPTKYVNTIVYKRSITAGSSETINLNSAPSGILSHIILNIHPSVWEVGTNTTQAWGSCADLSALKLVYGGQVLYQADSYQEISSIDSLVYGDNLIYDEPFANRGMVGAFTVGGGDTGIVKRRLRSKIYQIPLSHNAREVIRGHLTENLPSYSGATLQLEFTVAKNKNQYGSVLGAGPALLMHENNRVAYSQEKTPGSAEEYSCHIGYVIESLLEISQGTVDLQL